MQYYSVTNLWSIKVCFSFQTFYSLVSLKCHKKTHAEPLWCNVCSFETKYEEALIRHKARIHEHTDDADSVASFSVGSRTSTPFPDREISHNGLVGDNAVGNLSLIDQDFSIETNFLDHVGVFERNPSGNFKVPSTSYHCHKCPSEDKKTQFKVNVFTFCIKFMYHTQTIYKKEL